MKIKESCSISLKENEIHKYGGCSYLYIDEDCKYCYKKIRPKISISKRIIMFENLKGLAKGPGIENLIIPEAVYINENGLLEIEKMKFIDGFCGIHSFRSFSNTAKYPLIISRIIKLIQILTKKGYTITDLKAGNMVIDRNFIPFFIDNDFTCYGDIPTEIQNFFSTTPYNVAYKNTFETNMNPVYNLYSLYILLGKLLLTDEEFEIVSNITRKSTLKGLKIMNYFIQKNNALPMNFKLELRNIFKGDHDILINDTIRGDINDYLVKRLRRNS